MGDRANVYCTEERGGERRGVWLYTHWGGAELAKTVQAALQRGRERWDDPQYLARIIFCDMIRGFEDKLTGHGISAFIGDGGHKILVVDADNATIGFMPPGHHDEPSMAACEASWSFEGYCDLDEKTLANAYLGGDD